MMRLAVLGLFTAFIFWPLFGAALWMFNLDYRPPREMGICIIWFEIVALLGLLLTCAMAVETQPHLVRRILLLLFGLILLVIPLLALPAITGALA